MGKAVHLRGPLRLKIYMRQHIYPAFLRAVHAFGCVAALAAVPTLLCVRTGLLVRE